MRGIGYRIVVTMVHQMPWQMPHWNVNLLRNISAKGGPDDVISTRGSRTRSVEELTNSDQRGEYREGEDIHNTILDNDPPPLPLLLDRVQRRADLF